MTKLHQRYSSLSFSVLIPVMVPGRGHAAVLAVPTDTLLFMAMAKSWSSTAGRTHSRFHRRDVLRCLYL